MTWLFDTNAVVAMMKQHPEVLCQIRRVGRKELRICAPVEAELWFGVAKSARSAENRHRLETLLAWMPSLPYSGLAPRYFGQIRADLARQGKPIGPYDMQIAAIALAHGLTVVTDNVGEFSRVAGLKVENWQHPLPPKDSP